jgi:TetR/AcrR family transcriptional regulator, mexJK operon transcriptional repressor
MSEPALSSRADESPKRRQIVDAATDLFLAQGYSAISMDGVARAAGVSKATLYAYFGSKDELFATIQRERGVNNKLDDTLFPQEVPDLRAALHSLGLRILRFMLQDRTIAIHRMVVAEVPRSPELGRTFYANGPEKFFTHCQPWLAMLQARGLLRPCSIEVATEHLMALLRSSMFLRATLGVPPAPTEADIERFVAAAVDTWMRAFCAETARQPGFTAPADCA